MGPVYDIFPCLWHSSKLIKALFAVLQFYLFSHDADLAGHDSLLFIKLDRIAHGEASIFLATF